jgi:membrane protein YdbS with pleckstrin-like domain
MFSQNHKLSALLRAAPVIVMMTLINVLITSAVAGVVLIELETYYPGSYWPLGIAILIAVLVYLWIVYNDKLRAYITK